MADELLNTSLDMAGHLLDTSERAWIVGVAHLAELPLDTPGLTDEKIQSVISIATSTVDFPSGPVSYIAPGYEVDLRSAHRAVTIRGGEAAPHLEMQIGMGDAGFSALALTRGDTFDDGSVHLGGMPLTDLESVIADTYVLGVGSALAYGYTGPINLAIDVFDTRIGVELVWYAIDEDTGAQAPAPLQGGFTRIVGGCVFDESMTPRSAHSDIHRMAAAALMNFGVQPQLTSMLDDTNEAYSSNPLLYQDTNDLTVWDI